MTILIALAYLYLFAHDPGEEFADWYNSLRTANDGMSCCSGSHDCHEVEDPLRAADGNYKVFVEDEWVEVLPVAVLKRTDNPTEHTVACVGHVDGHPYVRCLVLKTEG